ncbi:alpha/beta fold hydrolase [Oryzicola mucosus]|uniref:Alpha/beta fold hydrolase n=1 Tax=Oryzicola mucosus TaxID=2767425 RepID=A0A8J6U0B1_9HYPH|nr:alpha/beta fold hydrolase [Oryzicola mucosus]MBD0417324.1 alpha/beta fold hydrolase [Oryzicola mucosus]
MDDPARLIADLDAQASHATTRTLNGSLVWRVWGDGEPVVLLHGGHGSWKHWIGNIPQLANRYRVYVPNLPGMGGSAPAGDTMEDLAAAIAAGVDELGISGRYFLAGFSLGSMIAAYVLDAHPDRVRHLFLIGTSGFGRVNMLTHSLKRWQEVPDPLARRAIHANNLSVLMLHNPEAIDPLSIAIQADNVENTIVNNRNAALAADMKCCLDRHAGAITAIWGREDALVRRYLDERIDYLSRRRPPGRSVVIPDAGHWVQYEAAAAVNAVLLETLDASVATSPSPLPVAEGETNA